MSIFSGGQIMNKERLAYFHTLRSKKTFELNANAHLRHETPKAMRLDDKGKLIPSRFGGGSHDAIGHRPISLRRPDSFYSKLMKTLDQIRASGEVWLAGTRIRELYNSMYNENRRVDSITKVLSRFHSWGFVDYRERPDDRRGGLWALKADVDIADIDDLLLRANVHAQLGDA
jgi:hypothetical protein